MKKLLLVCAALLVICGIVSGNLWRELRTERQANEELRTQLAQARVSIPLPALPALPAPAAAPSQASTRPATTPVPQGPPPESPLAAAAARTSALTLTTIASITGEQDLMKDPEYRKARLAQLRISAARSYPGLAEELGLSEKEANQLFELIAGNQLNMTSEISLRSATGLLDVADMTRRQQALQREQEDAIRAQLGNARYTQWQEYQQTRPARNQVVTMGSALASAGQPLTDAQTRALTAVMITEQQQRQAAPPPRPAVDPANPRAGVAQLLEENQRRQEESNSRVLEAAAPHLNTRQLEALRQQFEQQNAERRNTLTRLQEIEARPQALPQRP